MESDESRRVSRDEIRSGDLGLELFGWSVTAHPDRATPQARLSEAAARDGVTGTASPEDADECRVAWAFPADGAWSVSGC